MFRIKILFVTLWHITLTKKMYGRKGVFQPHQTIGLLLIEKEIEVEEI